MQRLGSHGAAPGIDGEGIGGHAAGIFQDAAGQDGPRPRVIGQIDHILHGEGPQGDLSRLLSPAVKILGPLRVGGPGLPCIGVKILAPKVQGAVLRGGEGKDRQPLLFPALQRRQVRFHGNLRRKGEGGADFQGKVPLFHKPLPPDGGPVPVALLGIQQNQQQGRQQHRHRRHSRQHSPLDGAVLSGAGGKEQQAQGRQNGKYIPGFGLHIGNQYTEDQHRHRQQQRQHRPPAPDDAPGKAQQHRRPIDRHRDLHRCRGMPRENEVAPVVYFMQADAGIDQQAFQLAQGLGQPQQIAQDHSTEAEDDLRPPPGRQQESRQHACHQKAPKQGLPGDLHAVNGAVAADHRKAQDQPSGHRPEDIPNSFLHTPPPRQ